MTVENLLTEKNRSQLNTILGTLLSGKSLSPVARNYLISCKAEGKSGRTVELYSWVLSEFNKNFNPEKATAGDIRLFLLARQESGKKPSTVHIFYRSLKTFYNFLVRERILKESPMLNIRSPKLDKVLIHPFNSQDIDNLMLLCSGNTFLDLRSRAMFLIFLDTGIRLEEMSRIKLSDLNLNNGIIRIMGKGSKERVVRIGLKAQKALLKYLLARKDEYPNLWLTEERRPMNLTGVKTAVRRYCARAVVSGARPSPHTFRHTFAIRAFEAGAREFEIQSLLGHSTLEMTRRYMSSLNSEKSINAHVKFSPVDNDSSIK